MKKLLLALAFAGCTTPLFAASPAAPRLATSSFPLPVPQYLAQVITDAAATFRLDPNLLAAMAFRESRFEAGAVSRRGAQGILQLMPRTARALGVTDAFDARQNVFGGAKYLRSLLDRFGGDLDRTLAAYNAGPELVAQVGPAPNEEAIAYVAAVKQYYLGASSARD